MTEADGKPHASTGHARAITGAPPVEHPPARGTPPCAPGAFSLTAPVFRSPRAQKGAWCARRGRQVLTGAGRRKCGSGCRDRQESASWGRRGSGARLSDGNRRGRKMVARDEQKRMAGRVAWGDALGVMTWVTATSRSKEVLTGAERRKLVTIGRQTSGAAGASGRGRSRQGRKGLTGAGRRRQGRAGRKEQADRKGQAQAGAAGSRRKLAGVNWQA